MEQSVESVPQIMKLTIFLTPTQWDRLSKWSAPFAIEEIMDRGSGKGPWLYMGHETNKYDEYKQHKETLDLLSIH
jgi:hypothetical protein